MTVSRCHPSLGQVYPYFFVLLQQMVASRILCATTSTLATQAAEGVPHIVLPDEQFWQSSDVMFAKLLPFTALEDDDITSLDAPMQMTFSLDDLGLGGGSMNMKRVLTAPKRVARDRAAKRFDLDRQFARRLSVSDIRALSHHLRRQDDTLADPDAHIEGAPPKRRLSSWTGALRASLILPGRLGPAGAGAEDGDEGRGEGGRRTSKPVRMSVVSRFRNLFPTPSSGERSPNGRRNAAAVPRGNKLGFSLTPRRGSISGSRSGAGVTFLGEGQAGARHASGDSDDSSGPSTPRSGSRSRSSSVEELGLPDDEESPRPGRGWGPGPLPEVPDSPVWHPVSPDIRLFVNIPDDDPAPGEGQALVSGGGGGMHSHPRSLGLNTPTGGPITTAGSGPANAPVTPRPVGRPAIIIRPRSIPPQSDVASGPPDPPPGSDAVVTGGTTPQPWGSICVRLEETPALLGPGELQGADRGEAGTQAQTDPNPVLTGRIGPSEEVPVPLGHQGSVPIRDLPRPVGESVSTSPAPPDQVGLLNISRSSTWYRNIKRLNSARWQADSAVADSDSADPSGVACSAEDLDSFPNPDPLALTLRTTYRTEHIVLTLLDEVGCRDSDLGLTCGHQTAPDLPWLFSYCSSPSLRRAMGRRLSPMRAWPSTTRSRIPFGHHNRTHSSHRHYHISGDGPELGVRTRDGVESPYRSKGICMSLFA
jgi:hypothetical protein